MNVSSARYTDRVLGWLTVLASSFLFYLATAIIRWSQSHTSINTASFVFARFFCGFVIVAGIMLWKKQSPQPKNYHYLLGRAVCNTLAVYYFYQAVDCGTVAEANILNMTYPLFVAMISWFVLKNERDLFAIGAVILAFLGVYLILAPAGHGDMWRNLPGLLSGITAGGAMVYLTLCRLEHDSETILLFMFGLGCLCMLILFHSSLFWPDRIQFFYLAACSLVGVAGQYCLTYGYRYVSSVEGSVISSSRILMAALLGPFMAGDTPLSLIGWLGALLIFAANWALAVRKPKFSQLVQD